MSLEGPASPPCYRSKIRPAVLHVVGKVKHLFALFPQDVSRVHTPSLVSS